MHPFQNLSKNQTVEQKIAIIQNTILNSYQDNDFITSIKNYNFAGTILPTNLDNFKKNLDILLKNYIENFFKNLDSYASNLRVSDPNLFIQFKNYFYSFLSTLFSRPAPIDCPASALIIDLYKTFSNISGQEVFKKSAEQANYLNMFSIMNELNACLNNFNRPTHDSIRTNTISLDPMVSQGVPIRKMSDILSVLSLNPHTPQSHDLVFTNPQPTQSNINSLLTVPQTPIPGNITFPKASDINQLLTEPQTPVPTDLTFPKESNINQPLNEQPQTPTASNIWANSFINTASTSSKDTHTLPNSPSSPEWVIDDGTSSSP